MNGYKIEIEIFEGKGGQLRKEGEEVMTYPLTLFIYNCIGKTLQEDCTFITFL